MESLCKPVSPFDGEQAKGWLPWGLLAPVLGLAFVVAGILGGSELIAPFVPLDARGNPVDPLGLMAFTLVPFALILTLLLAWVRLVERRPLASIGLTGRGRIGAFCRGHAIGSASVVLIILIIWLCGGFSPTALEPAMGSPAALLTIVLLLPCFALQSGVEELLFRGWLLSVVARKYNLLLAVVLSAGLFTLLHYSPRASGISIATSVLWSLFCCCWVLRAKSVWGVMGWHAGWNWLLAVGFGLPLTGLDVGIAPLFIGLTPVGPDWLTGATEGPEASVVCIGYFILATGFILLWRRGGFPVHRQAQHSAHIQHPVSKQAPSSKQPHDQGSVDAGA